MEKLLSQISNEVWGTPMLLFLLCSSFYLLYVSRLVPLRGFFHALKLVAISKKENRGKGQLSHFEALSNALAATIGLGNIAGVAVAIYQGGAGAIFWMWVAGFLGMNTKFFECTLALMYRGLDPRAEIQGGPMYYIENALPSKYKFLAIMFSIFGLIGTLSLFQINQLSSFLDINYGFKTYFSGIIFSFLILYILLGGLKRITSFTTKIVPLMGIFYVVLCSIILFINREFIPDLFLSIFKDAFTGSAALGGVMGVSVREIMQIGFKRAAFSNEAGVGTAPMAHGNAKTDEPISEGYVAMLGPFFDTLIICTMTALVILLGRSEALENLNGIELTSSVFIHFLGESGKHSLGIVILLFSFSTMVGMANYNQKCWDYLFKGKRFFGNKTFILYYVLSLFIGSFVKINFVVDLMDICFGLMALPNIFAVIYLSKNVKEKLIIYNKKHKL